MEQLDSLLSCRLCTDNNVVGRRIRALRNANNMTAAELADKVGLAEQSIRNYENGSRQPSDDKLSRIAGELGVPLAMLRDRQISSYEDVMHILFELSDNFEFHPTTLQEKTKYAITSNNTPINHALQAWDEKYQQWKNGQITQAAFQQWKDAFPLLWGSQAAWHEECVQWEQSQIAQLKLQEMQNCSSLPLDKGAKFWKSAEKENRYSDSDWIAFLMSMLKSIDLIIKTQIAEAVVSLDPKDHERVLTKLNEMVSTVHTMTQLALKD